MAKKVIIKKTAWQKLDEDIKHDEIVSLLAENNGAHPADSFALATRSANWFAWTWLIGSVSLGACGIATGVDTTTSLIFIGAGLLVLPFIKARKNKIQTLQAQPQSSQQIKATLTPEEERAKLKDEVRREMLKEELRKEIEVEKRQKKS